MIVEIPSGVIAGNQTFPDCCSPEAAAAIAPFVLQPRPDGGDDWPALMNALANYVAVSMAPGTWHCNSAVPIPNGAILIGNSRVTVLSTLAKSAPGDFSNCPFYNDGGRDLALTTLSGNVARGATVLPFTSVVGFAVGTRILVEHAGYSTQREVVGIVGLNVSIDRPVLRPYSAGDVVSAATTARNITILGNGMKLTGTGVGPVELVTARDCYVSGLVCTMDAQFGYQYDVASRDSVFERCAIDGGGTVPSGYLLSFGGENLVVRDCTSRNVGAGGAAVNVYIEGNDGSSVVGGMHSKSTGIGCLLTRLDVGDTIGCQGCVIEATAFLGAAAQAIAVDIGSGNQIIATETSYSQSGIGFGANAIDNVVIGGVARGNSVIAIGFSGTGNRVTGHTVANTDAPAYTAFAGSNELADCLIDDTSTAAVIDAQVTAFGAGTLLRMSGVRCKSAHVLQHFVRCYTGAQIELDGRCRFDATAANQWGLLCDAGVIRASGTVINSTGGGSTGAATLGATGTIRLAGDVDVSACPVAYDTSGGGAINRGTFTMAGVAGPTSATIAFANAKASDVLSYSMVTAGGTPGAITWTVTPDTGFTITGAAGDTSTYEYRINNN